MMIYNIKNNTCQEEIFNVNIFIMSDKINILIVEDEIKVAETIKSYLEKEGFNASFAILGSAAVNILNEKTFNFFIPWRIFHIWSTQPLRLRQFLLREFPDSPQLWEIH